MRGRGRNTSCGELMISGVHVPRAQGYHLGATMRAPSFDSAAVSELVRGLKIEAH